MHTFLAIVQIICAICIVVLVLVQRGKGADAGAGFGAGASGTVFGARGATTALSRATAILAVVFMATSLMLAYMVIRGRDVPADSLLEQLAGEDAQGVPVVPVIPATPADVPAPLPVPEAPPAGQ